MKNVVQFKRLSMSNERIYWVLAVVSSRCSSLNGRFLRVTHTSATLTTLRKAEFDFFWVIVEKSYRIK